MRELPHGSRATRITTGTTTAVKATGGNVVRVIIGATAAGAITFNDLVGTKLVLGVSYPVGSHAVGIEFAGKIEVVTAAASDITVVYD